ncbi:MAG: hypothetical protein HC835_14550 [Oscillatoriales cyanobacterium RM2_1_1]|nr:hypothetical protein [Oscillatoriales cyanobacterium RM2_1_1]
MVQVIDFGTCCEGLEWAPEFQPWEGPTVIQVIRGGRFEGDRLTIEKIG